MHNNDIMKLDIQGNDNSFFCRNVLWKYVSRVGDGFSDRFI